MSWVAKAAYGSQRIVITKNGKSVAALVPLEDYDVLVELAKTVGLREARLALKEATQEGTIPLEEVEKRLFG